MSNVRLPLLDNPSFVGAPDGVRGADVPNDVRGIDVPNDVRSIGVAGAGVGPGGLSAPVPAPVSEARLSAMGSSSEDAASSLVQVGDLARDSGKTVRAIHLYEELGLLQPAARSKGRYRLYGPDALVRVRWIGRLQEMGFSLTEIQTIVREWERLHSAPRAMIQMKETYKRKLAETREHIQRLESLKGELEASLVYLDTCEVCDPERMLSACKACDLHSCSEHVPDLIAGFRANV